MALVGAHPMLCMLGGAGIALTIFVAATVIVSVFNRSGIAKSAGDIAQLVNQELDGVPLTRWGRRWTTTEIVMDLLDLL